MRVGIPRGLLYHYYYPFWKTLFEELKAEVVVSGPTTKEVVNKGIEFSVPEICVPMKVFTGHVEQLVKDVDYVFIPRMVSIANKEYFCPKFMGLPDMIKYTVPGALHKILSPKIESDSDNISNPKFYREMRDILKISSWDLNRALKKAEKAWKRVRALSKKGYVLTDALDVFEERKTLSQEPVFKSGEITIGLMGYVYDLYDSFISMDIIDKLKELNVNILTFEMLDDRQIYDSIKFMRKKLFWTFSNKLLGAGYHFYHNPKVDGIIQVTAFGCGPDSMIGKIMELESSRFGKPFMTVRIDEHTGESHLQTRVEAFVDMIRRKKMAAGGAHHEGNLPLYGLNAGL